MQRKIELLEKISENALFHIDEFSFQLTVEDKGNMRKYFMELKVAGQSPSDVRFFLEEVAPEWEFLLESPKELTDYIKSYEEDNNPNDESLFHDLRTKYVEFLKRRESDSFDATERIMPGERDGDCHVRVCTMDRIESIRRQAKGGGKRITERGISKKDIGEEAFS